MAVVRCYSIAFYDQWSIPQDFNEKGKIFLPQAIVDALELRNVGANAFRISTIEPSKQRVTHATAEPRFHNDNERCYMPCWMMSNLLLEEGEEVFIEDATLPKAAYAKFRPDAKYFRENPGVIPTFDFDNFAVAYTCLTKDDIVQLKIFNKHYELHVQDLKPDVAVVVSGNIEIEIVAEENPIPVSRPSASLSRTFSPSPIPYPNTSDQSVNDSWVNDNMANDPPLETSFVLFDEPWEEPRNLRIVENSHMMEMEFKQLPPWHMATENSTTDKNGVIEIQQNLPKGTYVLLHPRSAEFFDIDDPFPVLDVQLKSRSQLIKFETVQVTHNNKIFELTVIDLEPADCVSVKDSDLKIEFEAIVNFKYVDVLHGQDHIEPPEAQLEQGNNSNPTEIHRLITTLPDKVHVVNEIVGNNISELLVQDSNNVEAENVTEQAPKLPVDSSIVPCPLPNHIIVFSEQIKHDAHLIYIENENVPQNAVWKAKSPTIILMLNQQDPIGKRPFQSFSGDGHRLNGKPVVAKKDSCETLSSYGNKSSTDSQPAEPNNEYIIGKINFHRKSIQTKK